MNDFRFENTLKLTESEYLAVWAVLPPKGLLRKIRLGAITAVGVLLLFTSYTLLLGLFLLGCVAVAVFLPKIMMPFGTRSLFRKHRYLREALTYGASEQKLWVKGARIDASVPWSMLVTWRETEGWLVLSPSGIPPLYLSLARLRGEGLYNRVKDLASRNAPEYNTSSPRSS